MLSIVYSFYGDTDFFDGVTDVLLRDILHTVDVGPVGWNRRIHW